MPTYYSNTANGYQLQLTVQVASQDVAANTSTVSWVLAIKTGSTYYNAKHTGNVVVGGVTVWSASSTTYNSSPSNNTKTIASGSRTYAHANDGKLTLACSATLRTDSQGSSWSLPTVSLSGSYVLPAISRVPGSPATPTVVVNNAARTITVTSAVAPSTLPVLEYRIWHRFSRNNAPYSEWGATTANSSRQATISPGAVPVTYQFCTSARNSLGWGALSPTVTLAVAYIPDKAGVPTVVETPSTRSLTITAPVAAAGGSPITGYQIRRKNDHNQPDWTNHAADANRSLTFVPDKPLTTWEFQARASTAAGWGPWSDSRVFTTMGNGPTVRVGGVWKNASAYVKVNGVWQAALCYVRHNGVWKNVGW